MEEKIIFCKGGGCTAKLGAGILERVLERLPEGNKDERLLAGFQGKEDAAIYRISDDEALVQTLHLYEQELTDDWNRESKPLSEILG